MKERITAIQDWLKAENIDAVFLNCPSNVFYASGFYSNPHERLLGLFLFQSEEPFLVCPRMEVEEAKASGWNFQIIGYSDTENPFDFIESALLKRGIAVNKIAIEKEYITYNRSEQLKRLFKGGEFVSAEEIMQKLRLIKDDKEISVLREAAKLADFGVEVGVNAIGEGKTEMEILATIEYELKKKGIREMSFSTMVLSGTKTASPHGSPGLKQITKGDLVLFDLGVVLNGYCSDITRTVAFGPPNEKQIEIYDTVLHAQKSALEACKPGMKIGTIDTTARNIIEQAGYGQYFTHRIGHGLGIDVHEYPSMNATNEFLLQKGMVFTVEPGIYVPGVAGVRIEDDLLITENGVETLTNYPKDLQIIQ